MRLKSYKSSKLHTKFTPIAIIWNAILWLNAYALGKNEYLESKVGVILGTNSERIMRGIITYFEDLLPAFCGIFSLALPTEINGHNVGIFNLFRVEYVTQEKLDHFINIVYCIVYCIVYTLRSCVDERHMKFVVSLPLNTAQGSRSAGPVGRG